MKTNYKYTARLLSLMITVFLFSCAKDEGPYVIEQSIDPVDPIPVVVIPDPTVLNYTVSFSTDIKPIFNANCLQGCHNPQHATLDLRQSVAYDQLTTLGGNAPYVDSLHPETSSLYLHLVGIYSPMPKNQAKLPQDLINKVYTWIYQGHLNN